MTAPEEALRVDPDDYAGPATVAGVPVQVNLHSWFEPIDGHVHWIGRIAANDALAEACSAGKPAQIVVGDASAEGRLSDVDPWGRFRISGIGAPPIPAS
ncbi:hypothetical protein BJ980_001292 [Nocardioides daedukensis]|uniref:DUF4873 domain-containing protein n=1 Tax=Nocardioides daedukensis TaxID=634462 RepID=A0A7Y9RZV6_9ACTN|nr:DUF4873 domain-containing protein [Nocardioides daedukensis]NYG58369.1 hypothetical protein [Nocardioides daedukensis]